MQLEWQKCEGGKWCNLLDLNLQHDHFNNMEGVYIIWHGGTAPWTVRVGQGVIRDRLSVHRQDEEIRACRQLGELFVTWARVEKASRDGVERFLAGRLNPKIGAAFPNAQPIEVNLPW